MICRRYVPPSSEFTILNFLPKDNNIRWADQTDFGPRRRLKRRRNTEHNNFNCGKQWHASKVLGHSDGGLHGSHQVLSMGDWTNLKSLKNIVYGQIIDLK